MPQTRTRPVLRVLAALVAAAQVLACGRDALAQVREIVVAPTGAGMPVGGAPIPSATAGSSPLARSFLTAAGSRVWAAGPLVRPATVFGAAAVAPSIRAAAASPVQAGAVSTVASAIRAQALAAASARLGAAIGRAARAGATGVASRHVRGTSGETPLARLVAAPSVSSLKGFFDQAKPAAEPGGIVPEDLDRLEVFLVRDGKPAIHGTVAELEELLRAEPGLAAELNKLGKVRFVLDVEAPAGELRKGDVPAAEGRLRKQGVNAALQLENIAVDRNPAVAGPAKQAEAPAAAPQVSVEPAAPPAAGAWQRWVVRPLTWPFREAAFLGRAMKASYTKPQFWEVIGGLGTEGVSFTLTAGTFIATLTWGHPVLLGASLTLLLAQNAFHGFWLNTWNNFQGQLRTFRGPTYQTVFNWLYYQVGGAIYRTLAWAAHPATTVAVWTLEYWRAIGLMSVVGTFVGVLGYNGINTLYDKGRINRWQRSAIQQVRNLLFLGSGPLFSAGVLWLFWPLFWALQAIDVVLFAGSLFAKSRPIMYVVDPRTAASAEFRRKYPAAFAKEPVSAWKLALTELKAQPPVMLVLWLYRGARYLVEKLRGKKA
ncbi:MAG: hypothetical protein HY553_21090 [Elusimicrobia bacterium]|nr:hypothetical protein [Elusimicrobiota bacterium]